MTIKRSKPRYFKESRQKSGTYYYWQPSKKLRQQGYTPRKLSDDRDEAIKQAHKLNEELDEARSNQDTGSTISANPTTNEIIKLYLDDPAFTELAFSTQRSYSQALDRIGDWCGDIPISLIPRQAIIENYKTRYAKTPGFANAIARVQRILFNFACDQALLDVNPASRLKLRSRPPRREVWSLDDQEAFIEAAISEGHPSMALAMLLAVCTGQRQQDLLALTWHQFDGFELRLFQKKTKTWVSVPVLPELKRTLNGAKERSGTASEYIVVSEATKRRYRSDHFRHLFRKIANKAGLYHLQFRDLRRTAVVRMAEAGISAPLITAVTGHDISHCERILETYMPRNSKMAREAVRRYQLYRAKTGHNETSDDPEQT